MKIVVEETQVIEAMRDYVQNKLKLPHVGIDKLRGIVPRKQNAGLTIELDVSVRAESQDVPVAVPAPVEAPLEVSEELPKSLDVFCADTSEDTFQLTPAKPKAEPVTYEHVESDEDPI